jgi:hypothetical protein
MRAITVKQPWASAIVHGGKDVENRRTNIVGSYRGPLAIIAGRSFDREAWLLEGIARTWLADYYGWSDGDWGRDLSAGAIIGVVDLVSVHNAAECLNPRDIADESTWTWCSPWAENNVLHLELSSPRPLPEPIPFTGFLGCRALPVDVVAQIEEQLR